MNTLSIVYGINQEKDDIFKKNWLSFEQKGRGSPSPPLQWFVFTLQDLIWSEVSYKDARTIFLIVRFWDGQSLFDEFVLDEPSK